MKIETRFLRGSFIVAGAPGEAKAALDLRRPGPYEDGEMGNVLAISWRVKSCVSPRALPCY